MSPGARWGWGVSVLLPAALLVEGLLHGRLSLGSLGILLLAGGGALYHGTRPWAGARRWYRVRYHSAAPPDPALLRDCLGVLLGQGAIVLRWVREPQGLALWLEVPAARAALLGPVLEMVLPDLRLEPGPPPPPPDLARLATVPLARAGTGHPADPLAVPLWRQVLAAAPPAELRLVLFTPATAALLWLGPAPAPTPFRPPRWVPRSNRWARLQPGLAAHYPWGADWQGRTLPLLDWPATATPDTRPLDTMAAYHLPPPAGLAGTAEAPYLELGISSTTGAPIRVSAGTEGSGVPAIWRGHFLSLGTGPQRFGPLAHLAQQAYTQGRAIFALDPQQQLLPALQDVLRDPALRPAWITRQHPRSSLRLNLLAVPPAPGPDRSAEIGALYLALTGALPLFEQFLARLGLAPWSTLTGGVLIHDLTLGLLLQHHRARIAGDPLPPPPTPAAIYKYLHTGPDVRTLLTAEWQAWVKLAQAQAQIEGPPAATGETYALAGTQLAAGAARWEAVPLAAQQEARDSIRALLQPLFEAPGFNLLWQAPTAPSAYFNGGPAPLTLTQIIPPDATDRDRICAGWYSEYLLLTVIVAAQARRLGGGAGPPMLVLLDDLRAWSPSILPTARLETLGAANIACALAGTRLPVAPDGEQILRSAATWWLHTPAPWDQPTIASYLAAIQLGAGDLPLVHFPPDLALLRTTVPAPGLATITTAPAEEPTAATGAA